MKLVRAVKQRRIQMLTILLMLGTALSTEEKATEVQKKKGSLDGISQFFVNCDREQYKVDKLLDLFDTITMKTVVFVNPKWKVTMLEDKLIEEKGPIVTVMDGEMGPTERKEKMMEFLTEDRLKVLISTSFRPLDVRQVSLVINYDLPAKRENYFQRIGRLGKFRRKRIAINFGTRNDMRQLNDIKKFYDTEIEELPSDVADLLT